MKTKKELQEHCQQYINSINLSQCNIWEKRFVNTCKEEDYQFNYYRNVFYKGYDEEKIPFRTIKELISAGANLPHILPKNYSQLLELHLKQLKELSHTKGIYRIDVRKGIDL